MTMVWLLVVLICLTMALTIAYSQTTANASSASSSEESKKTIVSEEKTLFSWGVVAALLAQPEQQLQQWPVTMPTSRTRTSPFG